MNATKVFYSKYGGKALVLGRFIPIVRTFAPILAGAINLDFKRFMAYNIIGAVLWITTMATIGFYLGKIKWVQENVGWLVLFMIVVTIIPVVQTWKKERAA